MKSKRSIINETTTQKLTSVVHSSKTLREVLRNLGILRPGGTDVFFLKDLLKQRGIVFDHLLTFPKRNFIKSGNSYGKLTAVSLTGQNKHKQNLWLFKCDCGTQCIKTANAVVNRQVLSCGCLTPYMKDRKRSPTGGFLPNKADEGKSGLEIATYAAWSCRYDDGCSFVDFKRLTQLPCHYCGLENSNTYKRKGASFHYNGLDRKDPSLDHSPTNIVPCCKFCNYAKHTMGYENFLRWVGRVYNYSLDKIQPLLNEARSSLTLTPKDSLEVVLD